MLFGKCSGSVEANLDVDVMGFGGSVGFKLSGSSENAMNFFSSGTGVMIITQANCLLHKMKLNQA